MVDDKESFEKVLSDYSFHCQRYTKSTCLAEGSESKVCREYSVDCFFNSVVTLPQAVTSDSFLIWSQSHHGIPPLQRPRDY